MKVHVITDDRHYFQELGLGLFWCCVNTLAEARKFSTRAAAAQMLRRCGKQHDGWRVITVDIPKTSSHTTYVAKESR